MMRSGNAVSFHIGLVPSEALYDKRGGGGERCAPTGPKKLTKTHNKGFPNQSTLMNYDVIWSTLTIFTLI